MEMMHKRVHIIIVLMFAFVAGGMAQVRGPLLIADRSWALSGDTVRFMVTGAGDGSGSGKVVHVRLLSPLGRTATQVMVLTAGGAGQGYMVIPDSLTSGVYRLQATIGSGAAQRGDTTIARLLTVYHRFAEEVTALPLPDGLMFWPSSEGSRGLIGVERERYAPRDEVLFSVTLPEGIVLKEGVVSATLGEGPFDGQSPFVLLPGNGEARAEDPLPAEENGFFIEGRVVAPAGESLPPRSMVLLSIPGEQPWFDYCLVGSDGRFRFMLRETFGTAEVYLRAIAENDEVLTVELSDGLLPEHDGQLAHLPLSAEMSRLVKDMTEAGSYEKIFSARQEPTAPGLKILSAPPLPFYGEPEQRVIPGDYVDLPDFREISRELLPAVKFRQHGTHYELQIISEEDNKYFGKSPLRLINGIPVFDDDLLFSLKSSDIRSIDLIYRERIFGDISFKGVVAILLNDGMEQWIHGEKNLFRFTLPCLQWPVSPEGVNGVPPSGPRHLPDLRRVFLFDKVVPGEPLHFRFGLSDLKGTVVLRVEGLTPEGDLVQLTRKISVR